MFKQILVSFFILTISFSYGQKVGINITSPEASLDVYGDVIFRSADLVVNDGITLALDVNANAFSYYRLTGPTAAYTIAGITQGSEGRLVTLFNRSGFTLQVNNSDGSATSTHQIITGTGADLTIDDKGIVNLQYDGAEQKWVVLSTNKIGSASSVAGWNLTGNSGTNSTTNFIGTNDNQPLTIKSFGNTVALFQHGFPSNNYIGANYQRTGIGLLGQTPPLHTLEVGLADLAGGSLGVLGIRGTTHTTHFNYGLNEHTYIRAGKAGGAILLNDLAGLGNVGIGTQYPGYKLDVNGEGGFYAGSKLSILQIQGGYYFSSGALNLSNPNLDNYPNPGIENNVMAINGNQIQTYVRSIDDPSISDYARSIVINPLGGNVGIGTDSPATNSKMTLQVDNDFNTGLTIRNPTSSAVFQAYVGGPANGNTISLGTPGNMPLALYTNSANRLFITSNGNIGIGTDSPANKLSVNGTIRSREVIVETIGWPDYVFSDTYTLPKLSDVENHILKYKHLPNIPKATDVENNGLELGEMQKKMMEKIEELTLYIIEQNKRIEEMELKLNVKK